ncbi:MAG: hypothetical protein K2Z81_06485 [Cyanobacteria bacterium]|nr:hypothetical protein [Cyanobacteriota bacterium]
MKKRANDAVSTTRSEPSPVRLRAGRVDPLVVVIILVAVFIAIATSSVLVNMVNQSEDHVKKVRKTKVTYSETVNWGKRDLSEYDRVILEDLKSVPRKTNLNYTQFDFSDKSLEMIGRMSWLKQLSIEHSNVSDDWLKHLERSKLESLDLYGTKITDAGLEHLGKIRTLKSLNIGATAITDKGIDSLLEMQELRRLRLDATLVTDSGASRLAKLKQMTWLCLWDTKIKGYCFKALAANHALCLLNISGVDINKECLESLGKIKSLKSLVLIRCEIDDTDLKLIANYKHLKRLELDRNPVSDSGVQKLAVLKNLSALTLRDCHRITDGGVAALRKAMPNCSIDNSSRFKPAFY